MLYHDRVVWAPKTSIIIKRWNLRVGVTTVTGRWPAAALGGGAAGGRVDIDRVQRGGAEADCLAPLPMPLRGGGGVETRWKRPDGE